MRIYFAGTLFGPTHNGNDVGRPDTATVTYILLGVKRVEFISSQSQKRDERRWIWTRLGVGISF